MFTKIGESKWMKIVLFITTFAFVGTALVALIVYKLSGRISGAAEVNGKEISMQRYMYEVNLIQSNLERQGVDIAPLRKRIQKQALNNIINEELVYQEAEKEGLVATKEEVKEAILNIPAFQENGVFSKERYLAIVNSLGVSPQFFEEILRKELTKEHIFALISGATYLSKDEIDTVMNKEFSQITGKVLVIKPEVKITEKEIKDFYKKNIKLFAGEKGKKVVVYKIDLSKTGKDKGGEIARKLFSQLKNNQPVEKAEGVEKVLEDTVYNKNQIKNLPDEVVNQILSLSEDKKIAFVKTKDAFYLAKLEKVVAKPLPLEKVKDQVKEFLEKEKTKQQLEKIKQEIAEKEKKGTSLKELAKEYKGKVEEIKNKSVRDFLKDYSLFTDDISKVLKTKEGHLSPPLQALNSIIVVQVDKITVSKENRDKDLEKFLKTAIFNEKVNDLINAYLRKLRLHADIKVNPRLIQ